MNIEYFKKLECDINLNECLISNICLSSNIKKLFVNQRIIEMVDHIFSNEIDSMKIINQKNSGTCWICSGITMCRNIIQKKLETKIDFNLSINHLIFWDKIEKANRFINDFIDCDDINLDDTNIINKLHDPISDGGMWHMFVDLVIKYGIIPEAVNTRKYNGMNTSIVNELIKYKLREFVLDITENKKYNVKELKKIYMKDIKKILIIMLGEPFYPDTKFTFVYKNQNNKKISIDDMTPKIFYENYLKINLNDFITISNDPRKNHPYYKCYQKNEIYGYNLQKNNRNYIQLNLPIDEIKKLIIKQIDDNTPVWFSNDITKYTDNDVNIMDVEIYEHELLFNKNGHNMTKGQDLDFRNAYPCHAMTITGYDVKANMNSKKRKREEEKYLELTKFKVENSWGKNGQNQGIYAMTIPWMEKYSYEFIINIKYLTQKQKKALNTDPLMFDVNDAMCKMLN